MEKRKCFKCKKPGHLAKDCPDADYEMAAVAIEKVDESDDFQWSSLMIEDY